MKSTREYACPFDVYLLLLSEIFSVDASFAYSDSDVFESRCKIVSVTAEAAENITAFSAVVSPSDEAEFLSSLESLGGVLVGDPLRSYFAVDEVSLREVPYQVFVESADLFTGLECKGAYNQSRLKSY